MKIYDMHIHLNSEKIEQNYLIEQMEQSGVYGGGIISCPPEEATAALLKMPFKERLETVLKWKKGLENRIFTGLWVHPEEKDVCLKVKDAASSGIDFFKIICDTMPAYEKPCMELLGAIEEAGKPVMFHSGILYSGKDTSRFNRPANWESLLEFENLKFSLAHGSWPWTDECLAVYGKFLHYYNSAKGSEMYIDTTPGTPKIYRKDFLYKLFNIGYDIENNIMFGTDSIATDYNPPWVKGWLQKDNEIMDEMNVSEDIRQKYYFDNYMRFLKCQDVDHRLPQINK